MLSDHVSGSLQRAHLTLDVEAINLDDLERTGAIDYYSPLLGRR
jgi:hypothetical protein